MKKKRQRRISILLIPDDNAEPYSFRLNWVTAKVILIVCSLLVVHLVGGVIGYWKFYTKQRENVELERSNTRLLDDNKRVYRLAALLDEMYKDHGKIMSLLGVESRNGNRGGMQVSIPPEPSAIVETSHETAVPKTELIPEVPRPVYMGKGSLVSRRKQDADKVSPNLPVLLPFDGLITGMFTRGSWFPFDSHLGLDIAGKQGSIIVAAGDGYVVHAGWHVVLGNEVIIHHGGNLFSKYGHNERLLVRENQYVKRGDPIALLGSSGESTGPHLHFEIWEDGKAIDPRHYLLAFHADNSSTH